MSESDVADVMADASVAFDEALRYRASDFGMVPIETIKQLTRSEWDQIRMMGQAEARRRVAARSLQAPTAVSDMELTVVLGRLEDVGHGR